MLYLARPHYAKSLVCMKKIFIGQDKDWNEPLEDESLEQLL